MSDSFQSQSTPYEWGELNIGGHHDDPPLDDSTLGYRMNHMMMRIRDPKKSMYFYQDLMGMRTLFTFNAGPFTTYYLTHPHTPEHRADLAKFSSEMVTKMQFTPGLLELTHIHGSEKMPEGYYTNGNVPPALGFGHLGFTVPDVAAAQKRLEEHGVQIFKPLGLTDRATIPITDWETERGVGVGTEDGLHPNFRKIVDSISHVIDPVSLCLF
jgi:lactoylglutathione lyase